MSKKELPEPWRSALEPKGVHSLRGLAAKADISPQTALRLVNGKGTSPTTVAAVADVLFGGDRNVVWRMHGAGLQDHGDWTLPPEASLLTEEQRAAVLAVVRAMVPVEQREELMGNAEHPAPTKKLTRDEQDWTDAGVQLRRVSRRRPSPRQVEDDSTEGSA